MGAMGGSQTHRAKGEAFAARTKINPWNGSRHRAWLPWKLAGVWIPDRLHLGLVWWSWEVAAGVCVMRRCVFAIGSGWMWVGRGGTLHGHPGIGSVLFHDLMGGKPSGPTRPLLFRGGTARPPPDAIMGERGGGGRVQLTENRPSVMGGNGRGSTALAHRQSIGPKRFLSDGEFNTSQNFHL